MTYGRVLFADHTQSRNGAVVSHLAELVRGTYCFAEDEGPLIRPSRRRRVFDTTGTSSPMGEGTSRLR